LIQSIISIPITISLFFKIHFDKWHEGDLEEEEEEEGDVTKY